MLEEEGQSLARELAVPFMETSAKLNINVDQAFQLLVEAVDFAALRESVRERENSVSISRVINQQQQKEEPSGQLQGTTPSQVVVVEEKKLRLKQR